MIELRHVTKSYGTLRVLDDISLSIPDNEIVAVVGPSGAGKTTLLQVAGTLDLPDSGEVLHDSVSLTGMNDRDLSRFRNLNLGFVFQFHQLLAEFSAEENVALPAMIAGKRKSVALREARELLGLLGLSDRLGHKPSELSGGERQRAAIARAMINKPGMIFADEPTGSLDSRNRDEICEIFLRMHHELGQSFLIVTHDPTISSIADRIITMADGKIERALTSEV